MMKTRRIRVRPTLRRNGQMMFPVRVEFTIGRDAFVEIGTIKALNEEKLPETRGEWLDLLNTYLREYGQLVVPDYLANESYEAEDVKAARSLAEQRIDSLFPDLMTPVAAKA